MNITVQKGNQSRDDSWAFFDRIRDVDNLDPSEEQNEPWEAVVNGEVVGMAIVDAFPSDKVFINRVAVDPSYRQNGIATRLLESIVNEYGSVSCRVHKKSTESQGLMEKVGFEKDGAGRYDELLHYSLNL